MTDDDIEFAIDEAIRAGDLGALRRLADAGAAFPNVRDACGSWYLVRAVFSGPLDLVQALLAAGADPNAPADDGFPSLFAAIDRATPDRHAVLAALLDAGASVQQRGVNDYTALHYAASRDDAEAVRLLLARGADPEARTRIDHWATPLEEAERFGHHVGAAALRAHATGR